MKKLKLETLEVTSFHTSADPRGARGTVVANADIKPGGPVTLQTYNIDICGDTQYFDCTLGCSYLTYCTTCNQVSFNCAVDTADCPLG